MDYGYNGEERMSSQKLVIVLENSPGWSTPPVFPGLPLPQGKALRHRSESTFWSFSVQVE